MDNLKFGNFIAELRKEKNMTQKDLADRLHVTDKAVSKWETGKGFPDLKLMEPLAQELEVSLVELLRSERRESETFSAQQTETVVKQAMEQSERVTARKYLRLLRWMLRGIACLCALPFMGCWISELRLWLFMMRTGASIIGGADGPTSIITTSSEFGWLTPLALVCILAACVLLAVKVRQVEKKLK